MNYEFILINLGYGIVFLALAIKEVLWLRITLTIAQGIIMYNNIFIGENYMTAGWNSVFVLVNMVQIVIIYQDRKPRFIPDEYINDLDVKISIYKRISSISTEEEKEEVETESLEARVEKEKKSVEEGDETEGSFISVDAAEKRNVKKSDLKLDEVVEEIQEDEFTCTVCYLVLKTTQLEKPRAKVCIDCEL